MKWLMQGSSWVVNGEDFDGRVAVGDTLECNGKAYAVLGINEDGVLVKELPLEGK
jgi:hypothetical protein